MKRMITIPKPCHEKWNDMTPIEKGRFCSSCKKDVIDFTKLNPNQAIKEIESTPNVCGRFRNDQLNVEFSATDPNRGFLQKLSIAIGISALIGYVNPIYSQRGVVAVHYIDGVDSLKTTNNSKPKAYDSIRVKGVVIYKNEQETIPFVRVQIINTDIKTNTDFDGQFELMIPKNLFTKEVTLEVITAGLEKQMITLKEKDTTLRVELTSFVLGGPVIASKPSFFQRVKNVFRRRENKRY